VSVGLGATDLRDRAALRADRQQASLFGGYEIVLELLLLNGALTFAGLRAISQPKTP